MKKYCFYALAMLAFAVSLTAIDSLREAFLFGTKTAYAANEPWYCWMNTEDGEVMIQFETSLTSRNLTVKEFCQIYGINLESGSNIVEQWCQQHDNSLCEMQYVGAFLEENGCWTKLPVTPEYMYY
ncbi:MAG: hypothetical protein J5705_05625 [Bacteroidaceae bacterium]|nr:hypothetical protein [Bacteroidaceae bacterium]